MILILSTESHERTTEEVMDWLNYWCCPFKRLNGETLTSNSYRIDIQNFNKKSSINYYDKDEINVVWFRRWHNQLEIENIELKSMNLAGVVNLKKFLSRELSTTSSFFFWQLNNSKWIDHPNNVNLNKLKVLALAHAEGLMIPKSIITTMRNEAINFLNECGRIITKPIFQVAPLYSDKKSFHMYTMEVKEDFLKNSTSDHFFPTLLQQLIEKQYDIRTFYLDGDFYSMAILSQRRAESSIDFRNYSFSSPDRSIPYQLPMDIEKRLHALLKKVGLSNCSIDLIRSKKGEHIFLEINPIGQFGMVSKPCNYHLEMRIANYLKNKNYEK